MEMIKSRISVDDSYTKITNYFQRDEKRRYMINQNFMRYLNAVDYLYKTSSISVNAGIYTAPDNVYRIINEVEASFVELERTLVLK
jgi:hypothetical protein